MIPIYSPVLMLVFFDEIILGLCVQKESAVLCRSIPLINPSWTITCCQHLDQHSVDISIDTQQLIDSQSTVNISSQTYLQVLIDT